MIEKNKYKMFLNKAGYRYTPVREAILTILDESSSPLTAEDLFLKVKEIHSSTNLSTVYRSLDQFTSGGILNKAVLSDGKARYELKRHEHHHHLICLCCKKTIPIENCPMHLLEDQVEKETDFYITGHNLEMFGYCSACKSQLHP